MRKALKQLISEKESELQNLEDSLGLGFPIVEQAKMTQISHLRLESEDLRQIEKSIQLNDNQKIVLARFWRHSITYPSLLPEIVQDVTQRWRRSVTYSRPTPAVIRGLSQSPA